MRCSWYTSVVLPHASLTVYLITKVSVHEPPCFRLRLILVRVNGSEQSVRLYPRPFTVPKSFIACTVSVRQATADAYTVFVVYAGATLSLMRCNWYTSVVLPHASLTVYLITKVSVQAPPCFRLRVILVKVNGSEQSVRLYPRPFTVPKSFIACTVSFRQAIADAYTVFVA